MSVKLAKLESMLADLERAAGLNPDLEVIEQGTDGTWPYPVSDAPLIVERVKFTPSEVKLMQRKTQALSQEVDVERQKFDAVATQVRRG